MVRLLANACFLGFVLLVAASAKTGTMDDMEHIVIFMQENRAFDHYYGTLRGVRGFNDRAAPVLPSGKNIFYQPLGTPMPAEDGLCGCATCDLEWTEAGAQIKSILLGMQCPTLIDTAASGGVVITKGEECSKLITDLLGSTIDHLKVSDYLSSASSCEAGHTTHWDTVLEDDDEDKYMLPFHLQFNTTSASCMNAPEMAYESDIKMFNGGKMDAWNTARDAGFGMAYFERSDLPYYYALADEFLIGDQYFQSTFTATNPNRLHFFSGSNGLSANNSYNILDDSEPASGITWETMGETLEAAGISWKVYQQSDNFDDNSFAWFDSFKAAKAGEPLYEKGMKRGESIVADFAADLAADKLAQVSWIVGPAALSEHANNHPAAGEEFSASIIAELGKPEHAAVYAKTAFILNYDEGGQFFDHHWPPTPPTGKDNDGKSTITAEGELTKEVMFRTPAGSPIGLGFRVPIFIISPWTRGGLVYSEVTDHTSTIQFIEKKFGVHCPNVSPWRRAITGDLTAAFDFTSPDYSWPLLPDATGFGNESNHQCNDLPAPTVPTIQTVPVQESGTRAARPLPYQLTVSQEGSLVGAASGEANITLRFTSAGEGGAAFLVFDRTVMDSVPRKYAVEAGKSLTDVWSTRSGEFQLDVHGPNGFVRMLSGTSGSDAIKASLSATESYDTNSGVLSLTLSSGKGQSCPFVVVDNAYGAAATSGTTDGSGNAVVVEVPTEASGYWYDVTVTSSCDSTFSRQFMGHVETGRTSTTDPAMAARVPPTQEEQNALQTLPESITSQEGFSLEYTCRSRRSRFKDACWKYDQQNPARVVNPLRGEL